MNANAKSTNTRRNANSETPKPMHTGARPGDNSNSTTTQRPNAGTTKPRKRNGFSAAK